ncbi:Crp/Fnr family transcriptional regulator [Maricaulis sp.]|uniref:Crp/Fnr family transcriptional regulator n=1 Tax=Maricaulis sp. TaxID=1486257 RepID=UPI001B205354|nr:Crp/Fnr family transcriptional regulator [Maricaulis sp.]MBO6766351.1 Crp/Fnr family transcriptional regulator [Maricaulis sp.]
MEQDEAWTIALDSLDIPEPGAREALIAMSEIRHVDVGTTIIAQEEDEDHVFILLEGSVRVVLLSENGQEIWLDWFGAGAIFGELAALTGKPRTSEIVAETPCRIAALTGAQFFDLLRRHGSIGLALCRILATRIHHTTQRMFELSSLSAPGRIYAELLRMSEPSDKAGNSRTIQVAPSMTELARRVNTTRETTSRTVNDLERRGLLKRNNRSFELVDPDLLSRMLGSS